MNKRSDILNELASISPEVARISGQLPYEAPAGYFEGLAAQILERIKAEEISLPVVLQGVRVNPFTVPAGYFEHLPELILQHAKVGEEVIAPVLREKPTNPYTVPAGYFEAFPAALLQRIKAEETVSAQEELSALSPLLSGLNKQMPFHTPEGYFSDLSDNAVSGARAIDFVNEELENLSPVMAALKGKQVYEAPVGYFDELPGRLLDTVKAAQPAKVVSIGFSRRFMRYAIAAAVVGIVAMSAWWMVGNSGKTGTPDQQVATTKSVTPPNLDKVSDTELQNYLEDETASIPTDLLAVNTKTDIGASDMRDMLSEVSDEEIQKYLEQNTIVKLNSASTN